MTKLLNNADVKGYIAQTAVTSSLLKTDSNGKLVAATAGTDYQAPTTALLPTGGTAGQILSKIDATNYNTQWIDNFAAQLKHEVKLGATLSKGAAVYVSSANGTNMIVSAASNASEATSSKTLGLLETGGVTNDLVKVITEGLLAGLDTSTATAGDPVWLGVNGALIFGLANKPVAPAHMVFIGIVTRVQSVNGEIFVKVQNGFELDELHNVSISSLANNQTLVWESATSLWKNKTIAAALGYTPADDSAVVKLTGDQTVAGVKTFTSVVNAPTLSLNGGVLSGNNIVSMRSNPTGGQFRIEKSDGSLSAYPFYIGSDGTALAYYYNAAGALKVLLHTNGTSYFGNSLSVGYGTYAATSYMFDVNGTANFVGALTGTSATFTGAVVVASPFTIKDTNPYIQWKNASDTRLGYIQHATDLVMAADSGNIVLNTTSGSFRLTSGGNAGFGVTSPQSQLHLNGTITFSESGYDAVRLHTITHSHSDGSNVNNWLSFNVSNGSGVTNTALRLNGAGQLRLNSYTASSSFTGTAAGYLAFDSSGNVITVAGVSSTDSTKLPLAGGTMTGTPVFTSAYSNGTATDYTDISNPAYKVQVASGYWRIVYKSASATNSGVYNYETGKNVYWGEPTDTGDYQFRGRTLKWVNSVGTEYAVIHAGNISSYTAGSASSVAWANISAGTRSNYNLVFQPNANDYAGLTFTSSTGDGAGYLLIRGTSDSDIYTAEGITLVADRGWLTLAQRTTASKGVRIMTGVSSSVRFSISTSGDITSSSGITYTAGGGSVLMKHAVSEVDAWIFQENAANWGLYYKNNPTGQHTFGGYTTVGAETVGMSAANVSGNGILTSNFVGATTAYAQWMLSNYTGYIWSASTIFAATSFAGAVSGSSYGSIRVDGTTNSYAGIYLSGASGTVTGMYDTGGNGGNWDPTTGWHFYWHRGNTCLGLGGSTTNSSYRVYANGAMYVSGTLTMGSSSYMASGASYVANGANNSGGFAMNNSGQYWGLMWNFATNDWRLGRGSQTAQNGWNLRWDSGDNVFINQHLYLNNNYGSTIVGAYESTRYQGVFAMGDAYKLPLDGTGPGNLYGLAWSHPNAGGQASKLNNHGLLVMINGVTAAAISSNIWNSGTTYSAAFRGNANVAGTGEAIYAPAGVYSTGNNWLYGALYLNGSNINGAGAVYASNWFRASGDTGLYSQDYGGHIRRNTNSYGNWEIFGYAKNGYTGIVNINNYVTSLMHNSSGDFGFLTENGRWWNLFYNNGNNCWGIGTDNTYSGDGFRCIKYGSAEYGWTTWSDRRAKENIASITGALDTVLAMRGVYFNYIKDEAKNKRVGFIAQELEQVLPEAVRYAEEIDEYSVEYAQIVSVLAEAIKEQNAKIIRLETLVEQLTNN